MENFWLDRRDNTHSSCHIDLLSESDRCVLECKFLDSLENINSNADFIEYYLNLCKIVDETLSYEESANFKRDIAGVGYLTLWSTAIEKYHKEIIQKRDESFKIYDGYTKLMDHLRIMEMVDNLISVLPKNWLVKG